MPADLETLVAAHDHEALAALLAGLDGADLEAARRWYRRAGRKQARAAGDEMSPVRNPDGGTVVLLLAVALAATGREAAKACAFTDVHLAERVAGARLCAVLELAAGRGPAWAQDFVDAAGDVRTRRAWDLSTELVQLCLPLVAHHGLDVPATPGYALAWAHLATRLQHDHRPGWEVDLAWLDEDGRASPVVGPWSPAGLTHFLRATPSLPATLERVLDTPAAVGRLGDLDQPGWSVAGAVRQLVIEGTLDRESLVGAVLATYARSDRPLEQRTTTRLLAGLDLGPADVAARVPFLLQVLPVVHGSVTAALLPALLAAPLEPDDLRAVGSTILLRAEKAQQVRLLDRLSAIGPEDPLVDAAVDLWHQAARLDDRTLSARAEEALRRLGADPGPDPTEPGFDVPWDDAAPPAAAAPFRPGTASAAGLARLRADGLLDPLRQARWLDLLVRWAATDVDAVRSDVLGGGAASTDGTDAVGQPLESLWEVTLRAWAAGRPVGVAAEVRGRYGFGPFTALLAAETVLRLGTPVTLLSTPSREDGTVGFDDLVARLRSSARTGYGPVDLLAALLRLQPTAPDRLALLDGLEVRPWDQPAARRRWWRRTAAPADDAVGVVREWVAGGGVPERVAEVVDGVATCRAVPLPAVPPALADHPVVAALGAAVEVEAGTPHWQRWRTTWLDPDLVLGVVPSWSEAVAADQECSVPENRSWTPHWFAAMVRAPGPLGPAVHLHATRLLGAPAAEDRAAAVGVVLAAVGQGRLDPGLFARCSLHWSGSGLAPLARTAESWEQVVLGGGLAFLWPTLRTVLQTATTGSPRPSGLAQLLRMLRPYAATISANVPGPVWPEGVVALARSSSSSKARAEARGLLEAVTAREDG